MSNKKLIQQYVGTGAILPEHQVNKLSDNIKKSYLRRRLQQYGAENGWMSYSLRPYEIALIDDESLGDYMSKLSPAQLSELLEDSIKYPNNIKDKLLSKIDNYVKPMVLNNVRVIRRLYDTSAKADEIYANSLKGYKLTKINDEFILILLQQTRNVELLSGIIEETNPKLIREVVMTMEGFYPVALLSNNQDEVGMIKLLERINVIGLIMLNDNNVVVAAKKLGLDVVKRHLDKVAKNMVDKFGGKAKDKFNDIVVSNSKDPEGMKELLKMLGYE